MDIAICTPCMDGRVHEPHMRSIEAAVAAGAGHGLQVKYLTISGLSVLPRARNVLVAGALEGGASQILFVDSDVAFSPQMFARIVTHPEPIVGGVIPSRPVHYAEKPRLLWKTLPEPAKVGPTGLVEAESLGTGFLRIRREVFEHMRETRISRPYVSQELSPALWPHLSAHFSYSLAPVVSRKETAAFVRALAEHDIPEEWHFQDEGEDFYFCRNAREAGFKIYADTEIRLTHYEGRCAIDYSLADLLGETRATPD